MENDKFVMEIKPSDLETWGDFSLEGTLSKRGWNGSSPVLLKFLSHNLTWCSEHGGPDNIIVPEYVFGCLAKSIAWLFSRGIQVEIVREDRYSF